MNKKLERIRDRLVEQGKASLANPPPKAKFCDVPEANALICDLKKHPHAYVIACIMDRQIKTTKAWVIPYRLKQRLGYFDFTRLEKTTLKKLTKAMQKPDPLHRFPNSMARYAYLGIKRIASEYRGRASRIWSGKPSSASIVKRFLEFDGVGPKIATMAANILVRYFRIPLSDYYSIDISVDTHVRRVFSRLDFIPRGCSQEYVVYTARELHPEYPGIFDHALWRLGRDVCRPKEPRCDICDYSKLCAYAAER